MWVVSLTYGIAVMAVTSALAFGMIWSVEKLAQRGIRLDWRMTFRLHGSHAWWSRTGDEHAYYAEAGSDAETPDVRANRTGGEARR
jgi:hypothetical protein